MALGQIDVLNTKIINENVSMVTFKVSGYKRLTQRINIGEFVSSRKFNLDIPSRSEWMILLFPKGQYDYGSGSGNSRVYIKMMGGKSLKVKVDVSVISKFVNKSKMETIFMANDNHLHWAGPFQLKLIDTDQINDSLILTCTFETYMQTKMVRFPHFPDYPTSVDLLILFSG